MFEKLEEVERRYETLNHLLSQPEVLSKQDELQRVAKEYSEIGKPVRSDSMVVSPSKVACW